MAPSASIHVLIQQLGSPETRLSALEGLLTLSARGHDVSPCAEAVVRQCLFSPSGTTPSVLALSFDILTAAPSHAFWVDTLSVIVESIQRTSSEAALVALLRIPSLPHSARQHIALNATTTILTTLTSDPSLTARCAAVSAAASLALSNPPLSTVSPDGLNLSILTPAHVKAIRNAIERLVHGLLSASLHNSDALAVQALSLLCAHVHASDAIERPILLDSALCASARSVAAVLVPSLPQLNNRFSDIFTKARSQTKQAENTGKPVVRRMTKETIHAFARLAAHSLSGRQSSTHDTSMVGPAEEYHSAREWATRWVDITLVPTASVRNAELASTAGTSLLLVCGAIGSDAQLAEKAAAWGSVGVNALLDLLQRNPRATDDESSPSQGRRGGKKPAAAAAAAQDQRLAQSQEILPKLVRPSIMTTAVNGLAALSKNDHVKGRFIVSSSVGLLPFALLCPARDPRLLALSVIASTVVEFDLSGHDTGVATALRAVLASSSWKSAIKDGGEESSAASELVCCFSQSLLDASKKISKCADYNMRLTLTHSWAVMLATLMQACLPSLRWQESTASSYAKEMYLKLFDALGQYSAFLMKSQGVGMEEYERIQQSLVKATVDQTEVGTRAAMLACITRYWLSSGLKAESNAGHILKAVWKHVQEHYRDKEILLNELQTGALWSEAKQGLKSRTERDKEGGYVSVTTALAKKTDQVVGTVAKTVAEAVEETLFGSVAFSSAAAEGSTLTTDLIYSGLSPLLALVSRTPNLADKALVVLKKYIELMDATESADFIAIEAVRNSMNALRMYQDEFFPKAVAVRVLDSQTQNEHYDQLLWLNGITESCIFAASRLEDPAKEMRAVSTEEHILDAATNAGKRIQPFSRNTTRTSPKEVVPPTHGDEQLLHGAADPFSVVASHFMDTVKALAIIRVAVTNRTTSKASNVSMTYSSSGALVPVSDAPTSYALGVLEQGLTVHRMLTLAVQRNQGFAGRVFLTIRVDHEGVPKEKAKQEQSCVPYYVTSSDVLLLRRPAANAAMDVFRRRWDMMRYSVGMHIFIRKDQSVDMWIDALERRSKCLRLVGRMRTYSHVCALVADSSRSDYVAVAGLAPEANGSSGAGPCVLYVTIRSNSDAYNTAFREECRDWLSPLFRVIILDEQVSEEDRKLALRPQDAFFVTMSSDNKSPYQRWRAAHSARMRY